MTATKGLPRVVSFGRLFSVSMQPDLPDALCREVDPEMFYPCSGEGVRPSERSRCVKDAKAVCALCSCRAECLRFAMDTGEKYGVWGGLTYREREALRREQQRHAVQEQAVAS